jgi:LmbE family N-acetylglucosaminyl deacetylase
MTAASAAGPSAQTPRTLVAVLAHADDEGPIAPVLARYAREGVQVYMIVVSDGSAGAGQQGHVPRPDTALTGEELATTRAEEARCAAEALGVHPPIALGFPDGKLGDYTGDRTLVYRATQRIAEELQRLHPDVVITWGPDGGTGHPDHRIVSSIVTQLQRTGAPGVPERLFYMSLPVESMRA